MADIITHEDLRTAFLQAFNPSLLLKIEVLDSGKKTLGILECGIQSGPAYRRYYCAAYAHIQNQIDGKQPSLAE